MTREEAIENLKEFIDTYITCHGEEDTIAVSLDNVDVEALDMAIKALEQEPRKDEVILTKEEYGKLVSNEFDNGYAKGYREALEQEPKWIPVSEKLPKDSEPVNIIWILHAPFYKNIRDKAFTATGVYSNGQWYWWSKSCTDILEKYSHNYADILYDANKAELEAWMPYYDDIINEFIEVIAWMPLPESYKGKSE